MVNLTLRQVERLLKFYTWWGLFFSAFVACVLISASLDSGRVYFTEEKNELASPDTHNRKTYKMTGVLECDEKVEVGTACTDKSWTYLKDKEDSDSIQATSKLLQRHGDLVASALAFTIVWILLASLMNCIGICLKRVKPTIRVVIITAGQIISFFFLLLAAILLFSAAMELRNNMTTALCEGIDTCSTCLQKWCENDKLFQDSASGSYGEAKWGPELKSGSAYLEEIFALIFMAGGAILHVLWVLASIMVGIRANPFRNESPALKKEAYEPPNRIGGGLNAAGGTTGPISVHAPPPPAELAPTQFGANDFGSNQAFPGRV